MQDASFLGKIQIGKIMYDLHPLNNKMFYEILKKTKVVLNLAEEYLKIKIKEANKNSNKAEWTGKLED